MNLSSGYSFWSVDCHLSVLTGDVNCEVAVIGAGITGALAGYHLAEAGV